VAVRPLGDSLDPSTDSDHPSYGICEQREIYVVEERCDRVEPACNSSTGFLAAVGFLAALLLSLVPSGSLLLVPLLLGRPRLRPRRRTTARLSSRLGPLRRTTLCLRDVRAASTVEEPGAWLASSLPAVPLAILVHRDSVDVAFAAEDLLLDDDAHRCHHGSQRQVKNQWTNFHFSGTSCQAPCAW
jgi:hypothetical protein